MFCTQCGSQVENEGKVCRACGAAIPERHVPVTTAQSVSAESAATDTQCEEQQTPPVEGRSQGECQRFKQRFAPFFSAWKHWSFGGRASRSEYWFGLLVHHLLLFPILVVFPVWFGKFIEDSSSTNLSPLSSLVFLVSVFTLICWLRLDLVWTFRRLHDCRTSPWVLLIGLLPFGDLALIFLYLQPSELKPNRHGDVPYLEP